MTEPTNKPQRLSSSLQLFRAIKDPENLCLSIDSGGFYAIHKARATPSPRILCIDPREAIPELEKEIGEPFQATIQRENRDPILLAASLRLRARRLKLPTTAPLGIPMIQPSWVRVVI